MIDRLMQHREAGEERPPPELRLDPRSSQDTVARVLGMIWGLMSVILCSLRWVLLQVLRGIGWTGVILLIGFLLLGAIVMSFWTLVFVVICLFAKHVPDGALRGVLIGAFDSILCLSLVVLIFHYGNQVHAAVSRGVGIRNPIRFTDGLQAGASRMAWAADAIRASSKRDESRQRREYEDFECQRRAFEAAERARRWRQY